MGDLLQTARRVEVAGELIRQRRNMYEAVRLRRANRPLVYVHGVEVAAFDAGNFRTDQLGAAFEIRRAILHTLLEPFVVVDQSIEMLLSLLRKCAIPRCRAGQSTKEVILRRFDRIQYHELRW